MRNNLIIVCLLSGLSLPVCGQSTLDDCIRYAWKHNPGFKNVQIDVKEARTDYVAAMGKFLPYVSVQAEVGRHIGRSVDPDTNGYTADSYNQGTIGMDITLSLFEGFARINRLRYTHWTKKEKEWDHLAKKNDLAYRVAEAYYKAVLDKKLSELAAEQLRLGERYLKQTEAFVELGLKSLSDLQEVKARHQGDVFRERMYEKNRQMSFLYLKEKAMFPSNILESYFLMQQVESPKAQDILVDVGAGNGIEIYLNGKSVMKHLNPYRCKFREEKVLLPLQKGSNQIVVRIYNRFEKETGYLLRPSAEQVIYKQKFTLPQVAKGKVHTVVVKQNNLPSIHKDTELSNLKVEAK